MYIGIGTKPETPTENAVAVVEAFVHQCV